MQINWNFVWDCAQKFIAIAGVLLAVLGIWSAANQFRRQTRINYDNLTLANLIKFSEMYQAISSLRRSLSSRFSNRDTSLNRDDCMIYYSRYWDLRHLAWDYFKRGLIPEDTFAGWMENCVRHFNNGQNLQYFEAETAKELQSRVVFTDYVLESRFRRHPDCRDFYLGLFNLSNQMQTQGLLLDSDEAFARVAQYVHAVAKQNKSKNYFRPK